MVFARILSMYTTWNIFGVLAYPRVSEDMKDIIRASSLLVLLIVSFVWFSGDLSLLYMDLFHSFVPQLSTRVPAAIKIATVTVFDALTHVVPCLLVGLPRFVHSILFAFGILLLWYRWARNKIHTIYSPLITINKSDRVIYLAGVVMLVAILMGGFEIA